MSNANNFKSSGGFDANNQTISNVADALSLQDALNLRTFSEKNTVPSYVQTRTYPVGFIVEYGDQLWKCVSPVTVLGAFDKTKWQVLFGQDKWRRITASYTASSMDSLLVDTTSTAITITLPSVAVSGDYILIQDAGNAGVNAITINRNGLTINGAASNVVVNESNTNVSLVYLNGTWVLNGIRIPRIKTISGATTLLVNHTYAIDASAAFIVTLPSAPKAGDWVELIDRLGTFGTNNITVSGNSKQIDGQASVVLAQKKGMWIVSYNGTSWSMSAYYGNSLQADKNLSELTDKAAARTALQLGNMAIQSVGTGAGEFRTNALNDIAYQSKDATLTAIAALVTAANKLIYATGPDTFAQADFPAQARTLLAASTQALQQAALGLGDAATKNVGTGAGNVLGVGSFGLGGQSQNIADPNTITQSGFYAVDATAVNSPNATYKSTLIHTENPTALGAGATQVATDTVGTLYVRTRDSAGVWSAWGSFATTGSLGTAANKDFGTDVGDLVEVGAFGLGSTTLPNIGNMNRFDIPSGVYRYQNGIDSGTSPTGSAWSGIVIVQSFDPTISRQTALRVSSAGNLTGMYTRGVSSVGGVSSAWVEMLHTGNTGTAATKNFGTAAGQLMEVGAFGLGLDTAPAITNLDTALISGIYSFGLTPTGTPGFSYGTLIVSGRTSNETTQIAIGTTTDEIKTRRRTGGAWSAWVGIVHTGNLAANLTGKTVVRELVPIWTGSVGSSGVILMLSEPIQANDEIVVRHNDAYWTLSHPLIIDGVGTDGRIYYWSFGMNGGTGMSMSAGGSSLTTNTFTNGYGVNAIYKVKYKIA